MASTSPPLGPLPTYTLPPVEALISHPPNVAPAPIAMSMTIFVGVACFSAFVLIRNAAKGASSRSDLEGCEPFDEPIPLGGLSPQADNVRDFTVREGDGLEAGLRDRSGNRGSKEAHPRSRPQTLYSFMSGESALSPTQTNLAKDILKLVNSKDGVRPQVQAHSNSPPRSNTQPPAGSVSQLLSNPKHGQNSHLGSGSQSQLDRAMTPPINVPRLIYPDSNGLYSVPLNPADMHPPAPLRDGALLRSPAHEARTVRRRPNRHSQEPGAYHPSNPQTPHNDSADLYPSGVDARRSRVPNQPSLEPLVISSEYEPADAPADASADVADDTSSQYSTTTGYGSIGYGSLGSDAPSRLDLGTTVDGSVLRYSNITNRKVQGDPY